MTDLPEALGLTGKGALVAIVGGGGKSTLLFALAEALPGRVVATTTTRIFTSQLERAEHACTLGDPLWRDRLDDFDRSLLVVGEVKGDRAHGVPPDLPAEILAHPRVDWVVVEADGSRTRPVKAPAEHEPVIPPEATLVVAVAGIDALAAPISEVAHRPERVCAITGLDAGEHLTPEALAALLTSEDGGRKAVPTASRFAVLVNKVESDSERREALRVADFALSRPGTERVAIGALRLGPQAAWTVRVR